MDFHYVLNQELSGGGKYEIVKDNFKRRLIVKNCHMKDDGEYTCKVLDKSTKANLFIERMFGLDWFFLAHLSWKLKWAFLITCRPSSVRLSVCLSVRL